jgi:hypothetical protein
MALVSTPFSPTTHGFRFINSFEFPYLFNISLPLLGPRSIGDVIIGLCGGMCCGALDYFQAGKNVPLERDVERIPLKLFRHLWARQLDTLNYSTLERLFTWAIMDTRLLSRLVARDEVPRLRQRIDAGQPTILVLIRSRGFLSLTQNHQVLATGYNDNPGTQDFSINLYDPNHPGKTPRLTMNLAVPGRGIRLAQTTGEPLRGFFVIDYQPKEPPED